MFNLLEQKYNNGFYNFVIMKIIKWQWLEEKKNTNGSGWI